ncbi:MAG TPA: hypothetical protein VF017_22240 [Thermoanaerobaculia bacterium]|nr:hypothetical protein [Thermoanaerobaculia bacterium]
MSDPDDSDWKRFLGRYVGSAGGRPRSGRRATQIDEAPLWQVRELEPDRFAVVSSQAPEAAMPDAVFADRRTAYLAAAVLTAFSGELAESGFGASEPSRADLAAELAGRYETGGSPDLTRRLLEALASHPAAIELLLEAMDPDTVAQAWAYLLAHRRGGSDTLH